jgi:NAD(P)H-dependent FMN reductase
MNIVGISFSYAENSLQTRGLRLLSENISMSVYDMLDFNMPICNSNKSDGIVPHSVEQFNTVLNNADILIFAISEATSHYSAGFKNALDWLVVKSKFNAKIGTDYTISNKPIFVITFTPTVCKKSMHGARHFNMTQHLLEKLGSNVIELFVVNDSWKTIIPGNKLILTDISEKIQKYSSQYNPVKQELLEDTSSTSWLRKYNEWNDKWKT